MRAAAVAAEGITAKSGIANIAEKKRVAAERAVRPVLPPADTPAPEAMPQRHNGGFQRLHAVAIMIIEKGDLLRFLYQRKLARAYAKAANGPRPVIALAKELIGALRDLSGQIARLRQAA